MRIKILHILHSLQVGGLENGVVNLINRLDPERFEHAICCITSSGPMAERLVRPVEIHELGKGAGGDYLLPLKIAKVVREVKPHIVHTRNWGTIDGVIAARLAGVRCVIHGEHGREATDPGGTNGRRNRVRRLLHPLVTRFVTVSDDLRTWLVDQVGIPGEKVIHIMNGVDTERFAPAQDKGATKVRFGLNPDSFVVGTVGRLDPVKDQQTLVRAFDALCGEKGRHSDLLLIGSGPEEDKLRRLADELNMGGSVHFMGERRDIPELLQAMDVFVLPSLAEGISNTILEAMACGLPVVATRVGGNLELVEDGVSGHLFAVGDLAGLAGTMCDYSDDPEQRLQLGARGRALAEQEISLAGMVQKYENLYRMTFER
ncbi:TIGR03088 family PEP-CTERM/XrtA system glycosyltransferase [Geobacter sp.]|uniref:TIGR03088 family PEP-CTERM/XrtA system glycosyltransferase n=1 Tax=Geobacter sp. TaxID=46610 RepID=UPI0027B9D0A5|nr:TIGR03088 family PEP-CTERM/XrtA system glycosyltransferase [Geobacter sp.]